MLNILLMRIRYKLDPGVLLRNLRFFCQTRDLSHWLFGGGFILIMGTIGFFIVSSIAGSEISRELNCLTLNIYHEARGEPTAGKYAVGRVTLNRVNSRHYPDTICEVVYQKRWDTIRKRYVGAFSWTEIGRPPTLEPKAWEQAIKIAEDVYYQRLPYQVGQALFYHADHIRPSWARKKTRVAKIGRHIFYN
ncbi:MAG: cell wall hydrolase [Gammaproteobacteria bacterium]|nr:cell wall hydrolase [Gammaproteobacteria bacterium]MDH5654174.1 cell wall hydrolase [Gammaproteobacteria bacterium]